MYFIPAKSPFSLHHTIYSHGWIRLAPFEADEGAGGFRTLLRLGSGQVIELLITDADGGRIKIGVKNWTFGLAAGREMGVAERYTDNNGVTVSFFYTSLITLLQSLKVIGYFVFVWRIPIYG